ncbi:hypothetical protein [Amycolatopsis sp. NPDC051061]|uniref:hypothetical protein n=1 Tax=Amycolatopsis sp. NPDC051061 TaxID=3155042 RepID=UPI0034471E6F
MEKRPSAPTTSDVVSSPPRYRTPVTFPSLRGGRWPCAAVLAFPGREQRALRRVQEVRDPASVTHGRDEAASAVVPRDDGQRYAPRLAGAAAAGLDDAQRVPALGRRLAGRLDQLGGHFGVHRSDVMRSAAGAWFR